MFQLPKYDAWQENKEHVHNFIEYKGNYFQWATAQEYKSKGI